MTRHGAYAGDGDPGPWPAGSVPTCPMCGIAPNHTRPAMTAISSPPGWWCTGCDYVVPPDGGRLTDRQRKAWADGRRDRSHDDDEVA